MKNKLNKSLKYNQNKPLINSTIFGLFYFLFCWSLDFVEFIKPFFIATMLYLPGITFPLSTCYYKTNGIKYIQVKRIIHLFLSVTIYYSSVFIFTNQTKYITLLAGLFGSFIFLILTKIILKKEITINSIISTSILSGLVFFPYEMWGNNGFYNGIAVLFWTILNGYALNNTFKIETNILDK